MHHLRFFQIAIWLPFIGLLIILLGDWIYQRYDISTEQTILIYWLGFGVVAYPVFATWAARHIKKKSEPTIVRLLWWAPIIFIPFYGVPWVLYGLAHIVMGETSGIAMALLWIAFVPYIIVVGYVFAVVTFVIYEMFFISDPGHEVMPATPNSIAHLTGDAKLFDHRVEHESFVSGIEDFSFYPRKAFLGHQGLFAYHAILMITDSDFENFCELIRRIFEQATIKQGREATYSSGDGSTLQLAVRQEFNGLIIEMITNSKALLEGLDASFKAPPPPWIAFPKMEPIEAEMDKQGSLEYWWSHIWLPFWSTRTPFEKEQYLLNNGATAEWSEVLT